MQLGSLFGQKNEKEHRGSTVELVERNLEANPGGIEYQYEPSRNNQLRALLFKTVATQKHQWMITAGCALACPALVVGVGGIIALTAGRMLDGVVPSETTFCARTPLMDSNNVPIDFDFVASPPNATSMNYAGFFPTDLFMTTGRRYGCANWFGENYPMSAPYSLAAQGNSSSSSEHDTTYLPRPMGGWSSWASSGNQVQSDSKLRSLYGAIPQYRPWSFVQAAPGVNIGSKSPSAVTTNSTNSTTATGGSSSGLLGAIPSRSTLGAGSKDAVYFVPTDGDINEALVSSFNEATNAMDRNTPIDGNFPYPPFGAILFDKIDGGKLDFTLQIGAARRYSLDNKINKLYPTQGFRQLVAYSQVMSGYVATKYSNRVTITP
ncbi:hypothetical protein THASP1DRAFT_32261, partial [Thamnocephalis sphaerospora]